jgi:hypothetical protein
MTFGNLLSTRFLSVLVCTVVPSAFATTRTALADPTLQLEPIPEVAEFVPPNHMLGLGLAPHHYDAVGYPESYEGLLIVEQHPQAGPVTMVHGLKPHYLEAQFVTTQRDSVWLSRSGPIVDVLPNGTAYEIPYGYGAVKQSLSALTLVEAQLQPHISDNQKSYKVFPLEDIYLGATLSLVGLRADLRYVQKERYVGYVQAGLNLLGMAGANVNRTYESFAVPIVVGGGLRYPSLWSVLGTNWTTGVEAVLGLGSIDNDPDTANVVFLPGLFHEFEWVFHRDVDVIDYRADARPYNYGVQSFYAKVGAYADFTGGATNSVLLDIHVGYRFNLHGPNIPQHAFKETQVTFASQRYVQRKLDEKQRQTALEGQYGTPTGYPPNAGNPTAPNPSAVPIQPPPAPVPNPSTTDGTTIQ